MSGRVKRPGGRPAYLRDRDTAEDIRILRARGYTWAQVALSMGMDRKTLWRIRRELGA